MLLINRFSVANTLSIKKTLFAQFNNESETSTSQKDEKALTKWEQSQLAELDSLVTIDSVKKDIVTAPRRSHKKMGGRKEKKGRGKNGG